MEHLLKDPTSGDEIVAREVADENSQQLEGNSLQYFIAGMKETKDNSEAVDHNKIVVEQCNIMFLQHSRMDIEIEMIRMLIVNMSQRRHTK